MKFLCLHGAYGNAETFEKQLEPFLHASLGVLDVKYTFITGRNPIVPPPSYPGYFGNKPVFTFIPRDGADSEGRDIKSKLDDFPTGDTPEETIRTFKEAHGAMPYTKDGLLKFLDHMFETLDGDPDIQGIIGFSEGAAAAASLILEEKRRYDTAGIPRQIKCGVFFSGWPPLALGENDLALALADTTEDRIDVPTCHVIGSDDPYLDGAMALYNVCEEDSAILFDHGTGHFIPRDQSTLSDLCSVVASLVDAMDDPSSGSEKARMSNSDISESSDFGPISSNVTSVDGREEKELWYKAYNQSKAMSLATSLVAAD
ncbi:hypothetical protein HIM_05897 [Hirsutella minnesotensis 3608]|uniref:Serine hydrolase domain-containing protein n=1 Tax=Hirsutella minnesotensis 3608 TaxID=1043627 RepID=A0A0F7ZP29_9HYPO|nr:hypothetical protein HIM_05897 [Hirsutella minnesotensis 3608]